MKHIAWFFKWILKAAIFFTLFAFALNNQHDVTVRFFFGQQWTAPLVLVVLIAFALGLVIGVLGMVPRWWRHRRAAALARRSHREATIPPEKPAAPPPPSQPPYGI
ncbi:MAG: LapA family protein [Burkholderiales bacterium]|nr:LapA family protein [Burkholderiales bacterium]